MSLGMCKVGCATVLSLALQALYFFKTYLSSVSALSQNVQYLDSFFYYLCGPVNIFAMLGAGMRLWQVPGGG